MFYQHFCEIKSDYNKLYSRSLDAFTYITIINVYYHRDFYTSSIIFSFE